MRVLALLDGTLADPEAPLMRPDDLSVTRGDGVFETILVVDGKPRALGPHLDRLRRSADMLDFDPPERAGWERAAQAVIDAWPWQDEREMALKLVCSRGVDGDETPHGFALGMTVGPDTLRKRADGLAAITLDRGYAPDLKERAPWLLLSAKTLSYAVNMAAIREARRRDADEVIFTATDGTVLEGPTSTVVLARGRTLRTPPPSTGILPGTTQDALFRAAEQAGWETRIEPFGQEELRNADGLWMASSVRLITPVHTLDGTSINTDPQLHAELTDLYESQY